MRDDRLIEYCILIQKDNEIGNDLNNKLQKVMKKFDIKESTSLMKEMQEVADHKNSLVNGLMEYILEMYMD